jgi:hypothetical protein
MTDHETAMLCPSGWATVNGHEPLIFHNVTMGRMTIHCQTCGWISETASRRHRESFLDKQWRTHAGDLAVGIKITHGRVGNGCHCARCLIAGREAAQRRTSEREGNAL